MALDDASTGVVRDEKSRLLSTPPPVAPRSLSFVLGLFDTSCANGGTNAGFTTFWLGAGLVNLPPITAFEFREVTFDFCALTVPTGPEFRAE